MTSPEADNFCMKAKFAAGVGIGFVLLALPLFAMAQPIGNGGGTFPVGNTGGPQQVGNSGDTGCPQSQGGTFTLCNPLTAKSFCGLLRAIFNAILTLAIPVGVIFIVYAGFKYIIARGNPGEIAKAHKNFLYVIIGTALILSAWVLSTLIGGTITQLLGNG